MNPYIGYAGDPEEGAVLVFAPDARTARPVAYGLINGWAHVEYTDVRVRRLRQNRDWLMQQANPRCLALGKPHGTDDIPSCRACERWSGPLNDDGHCGPCAEVA